MSLYLCCVYHKMVAMMSACIKLNRIALLSSVYVNGLLKVARMMASACVYGFQITAH